MLCLQLGFNKKRSTFQTITFVGDILNDNGLNFDHLGHVVYAEAIAGRIKNIQAPVTIGLFARWGSGKSFLLKHIQSKIVAVFMTEVKFCPPSFFRNTEWTFNYCFVRIK